MKKVRIGLLGGTFDPPHLGHLIVAEQARDQLDLDEVRLVVAKDPWQKTGNRSISSGETRLAMTRAALGTTAGLTVSDVEFGIAGPTYTTVTLEHLRVNEPEVEWVLILGSDTASGLMSWHEPARLAKQCTIAVVNRLGSKGSIPSGFDCRASRDSWNRDTSTDVRRRIASGRSVRFLMPEAVIAICEDRRSIVRAREDDSCVSSNQAEGSPTSVVCCR